VDGPDRSADAPAARAPASSSRGTVRLSLLDRAFLVGETLAAPCHVAYLSLLTPPPTAKPDFGARLVERLRIHSAPVSPFDRRLDHRHGGSWVPDASIDMAYHVVRLGVALPGSLQELLDLVAELHAMPLDRSHPLWRLYVIDGLAEGRIATYCKMHHAVADGVSGTRLLLRSLSTNADQHLPPAWAIPAQASPAAEHGRQLHRVVAGVIEAVGTVPTIVAGVLRTRHELREGRLDAVGGSQAPASLLNCRIGTARTVATRSYSLSRIQALCRTFDGSTNALMLALFSSALRRYLEHDCAALPEAPLIAMVPMSTRLDETAGGNQVAPLLVNLFTDRADPVDRMRAIFAASAHSLNRVLGWTPTAMYGYSLLTAAAGVFNLLLRPDHGSLPFNVVISKLEGPRVAMFWQGCRLDALYPVSMVTHGQALNLTYAIRHDTIDVGLVACARSLPKVDRVLAYVGDAIDELEWRARRLSAQTAGRSAPAFVLRREWPPPVDAERRLL
jgi:diacylglycerol O-acyltransferase